MPNGPRSVPIYPNELDLPWDALYRLYDRSMTASDSDGDEAVFLSPLEEATAAEVPDQGASPTLRRSTRKRKSTSAFPDMTKGSSTKKKKKTPPSERVTSDPGKAMPKIPRTPQAQPGTPRTNSTDGETTAPQPDIAALLAAMENRITAKIEKNGLEVKEAIGLARQNKEALGQLEVRVDRNDASLRAALVESERKIQNQVRDLVDDQLRQAGFDKDLTAADLSTRLSARQPEQETRMPVLQWQRSRDRQSHLQ